MPANQNYPYGCVPVKHLSGGTCRINQAGQYTIAYDYTTAIAYGQVVSKSGSGMNLIAGADSNAAKVGVFLGCEYQDANGNFIRAKNWPSGGIATLNNSGAKAFVADDPKQVFRARMSGALTAADVGQFAGLVVSTPNALGVSQSAVNSSDITGTADVFKILGLVPSPGNDYGDYSEVYVMLGVHEYAAPAAS